MTDFKTIRELESIPSASRFSKCNQSLDKLFKSRSLKDLLVSLKCPHKINYYDEKPDTPEKDKNEEISPDSEKLLLELYKHKIKEQEKKINQAKKIVQENKNDKNIRHFHRKHKIIEPILDHLNIVQIMIQ